MSSYLHKTVRLTVVGISNHGRFFCGLRATREVIAGGGGGGAGSFGGGGPGGFAGQNGQLVAPFPPVAAASAVVRASNFSTYSVVPVASSGVVLPAQLLMEQEATVCCGLLSTEPCQVCPY